jgi:phospholipase D1/2
VVVDHIFFFNLRTFDRLNKAPALEVQAERPGAPYQDVQGAHAEEIMRQTIGIAQGGAPEESRVARGPEGAQGFKGNSGEVGHGGVAGVDSVAKDAMLHGNKVSDEAWAGTPESERQSFIQEELYVHAKVGSSVHPSKPKPANTLLASHRGR